MPPSRLHNANTPNGMVYVIGRRWDIFGESLLCGRDILNDSYLCLERHSDGIESFGPNCDSDKILF